MKTNFCETDDGKKFVTEIVNDFLEMIKIER